MPRSEEKIRLSKKLLTSKYDKFDAEAVQWGVHAATAPVIEDGSDDDDDEYDAPSD